VSPSPYALPMASLDLSRLVEKVVGYPQLVEMDDRQRQLRGPTRQAAILEAEQNQPKLRFITGE
jgi:hypothetical protein